MSAALSPGGWTLVVVGAVLLVALLVVLRIVTRDRTIRGVRVGIFYERDRDEDDAAYHERLARKDDLA